MAKFITFNKLTDLRKVTINMDLIKTMEPVSKIYDGHMKDCTDIYYENHRITVLDELDDIVETISNMEDGDIVDISENLNFESETDSEIAPPDDPGGTSIEFAAKTIDVHARNIPGDNVHQLLVTDIGMTWSAATDHEQFTIDIPEDQDYVYVVYYDSYTNGQYDSWAVFNIYADEQQASLDIQDDTQEEKWHGPIQVPMNTIFDLNNDNVDYGGPIDKIYVASKRTIKGPRENNVVFFGISDSRDGAAEISNISATSESIREFGIQDADEIEMIDNKYKIYLVYYITYKSKGGKRPYRHRFLYKAVPSGAFKTEENAQTYMNVKNSVIDVDTMGYEYRYKEVYTNIQYGTIAGGALSPLVTHPTD